MTGEREQQIDEIVPVEGVELNPEESPYAASEEAPQPRTRRRGFRLGLIFGIVAGAVVALILAPKGKQQEPPAALNTNESADGTLAKLRSRLRDAADEAREASREAQEAKRARFSELLERQ